jgi:hypothetical protein
MLCVHLSCGDGSIEGVVVDMSRNDRLMGVMWRKRGGKEKAV